MEKRQFGFGLGFGGLGIYLEGKHVMFWRFGVFFWLVVEGFLFLLDSWWVFVGFGGFFF